MPSDLSSLRAWLGYVLRGRLGGLALSSFFINMGVFIPALFGMLVYDKVVHNGIFETLWALAIGVVLYLAIELVLRSLRVRSVERVAKQIDRMIDHRLFTALLQPSARSGAQPGMAARFLTLYRDLASARDFFSSQYLLAMADVPFLLLILVVIGLIAWPLLVVVLCWIGLYVLVGQWLKDRTQTQTRHVNAQQAAKLALLTDTLSSLDTLRTSHAGSRMQGRFETVSQQLADSASALRLSQVLQTHWQMAVSLLSYVSLLVVGAYLIFGQFISVGALIAVSMLSGRTLTTVGQVLLALGRWTELRHSMAQLAPYLTAQAGQGDVHDFEFTDFNSGNRRRQLVVTPSAYLSYYEPEGLANMAISAKRVRKAIPVFYAGTTQDGITRWGNGAQYVFNQLPPHPQSVYLESRASHMDVPQDMAARSLEFLKALALP